MLEICWGTEWIYGAILNTSICNTWISIQTLHSVLITPYSNDVNCIIPVFPPPPHFSQSLININHLTYIERGKKKKGTFNNIPSLKLDTIFQVATQTVTETVCQNIYPVSGLGGRQNKSILSFQYNTISSNSDSCGNFYFPFCYWRRIKIFLMS